MTYRICITSSQYSPYYDKQVRALLKHPKVRYLPDKGLFIDNLELSDLKELIELLPYETYDNELFWFPHEVIIDF